MLLQGGCEVVDVTLISATAVYIFELLFVSVEGVFWGQMLSANKFAALCDAWWLLEALGSESALLACSFIC